VKCSSCQLPLGGAGFVVSLVGASGKIYTATVHELCMDALIGRPGRRVLDKICIDTGWEQAELSGFGIRVLAQDPPR
jgi:hypothetical protein